MAGLLAHPAYRGALVCVMLGLPLTSPAGGSTQTDPLPIKSSEYGERLYLDGVLASGGSIAGSIKGDIPVRRQQIVCISCHRRSGLGASESGTLVPPITGEALFRVQEPRRQQLYHELYAKTPAPGSMRPAYTEATLARAIRTGLDPNGRQLHPLMPRYDLSDEDITHLIAYLKTLSSSPGPGVSASHIHVATITTDRADPEKTRAMLKVLNRYFDDKNAQTRGERQRADRPVWYKSWYYETYREWALHVWQLRGDPDTWLEQLNAYYGQQPVFAVVSGIAGDDWSPIHRFCESANVPCLFPNTDLPQTQETGTYSLYFSEGVTLEAKTLAHHLSKSGRARKVMQVFGTDKRGTAAAAALRNAVQNTDIELHDYALQANEAPDQPHSKGLADSYDALVIWLNRSELAGLRLTHTSLDSVPAVYFSSTLMDGDASIVPENLAARGYMLQRFAMPGEPATGQRRTDAWLKARGIDADDRRVLHNTYFAATMFGAALARMLDNYSRDYLIEKIEHMTENALSSGAYPHLSLGPGQRFASKGCYIAKLATSSGGEPQAMRQWIIP